MTTGFQIAEDAVRRAAARVDASRVQMERSIAAARSARLAAADLRHGHRLLLAVADATRDVVRQRVESAVEAALQAVFGPAVRFRLEVSVSRNVVGMSPQVGYERGGSVDWFPAGDVGGGVVNVVSFAFRVAMLCWRRPRLRPILVADEPFAAVSDEYLPAVAAMLRELSTATGLQLVVVSHEPAVAGQADLLIRVESRDGASRVMEEEE